MKKILLTKKLHFNFFLHNLHTIKEGIIEIFGKIKIIWVTIFMYFSPNIYHSFFGFPVMLVVKPVNSGFIK
jgi:hypothetical protein